MGQKISITIMAEDFDDLKTQLRGILGDGVETSTTEEAPKQRKPREKKEKTPELDLDTDADDTDADELTPEKKRELMAPFIEKNKKGVKALLDKLGVARISEVEDDDWDTFFTAVKKLK
jgi:DNA primase catalytic subunit